MKKLCIFLCLLLPLCLFVACNGNETETTSNSAVTEKKEGIELSVGTRMTIGVGETKQIQAINMKNATQMTNVVWTSEDPAIANVDFNGNVTGVADGETTITAASIDGKYKASCKVSVSSVLIGMSFESPSIEMEKGTQTTLKLILTPANLEGIELTWMTGDPKVATVENGVVTAVGNGSTSIIVSAESGINAVCTINVVTNVTGISLDSNKLSLRKGETYQFVATLLPEGASDPGLEWTSSNTDVATVNSQGVVKAIAGGSTVITAKTPNGKLATCSVTVSSPVTGVSLDREEIVLNINQADQLIVSILPEDASDLRIIWDSSDVSIVTVSSDGKIMGLKAGTVEITAITLDGYFRASCTVIVKNLVTEITFGDPVLGDNGTPVTPSADLELGKNMQLVPNLIPADCDIPVLTWTSSNPAVALVGADGTVVGLTAGEAIITVTSDNGVSAEFIVRVVELEIPIQNIIVNPMMNLKIGKSAKLNISLLPVNTTEGYTIVSSNPSVVSVKDGILTPKKKGNAIITITSKSGEVTAECAVFVDELTEYELEEYRQEYEQKKADLETQTQNNQTSINEKWNKQIGEVQEQISTLPITSKDDYKSKRDKAEQEMKQIESWLKAAIDEGNQEKINQYTSLKDTCQKEIDDLDYNWKLYELTTTQLSNLHTSLKNELANERVRYQNALDALNDEYSFLN